MEGDSSIRIRIIGGKGYKSGTYEPEIGKESIWDCLRFCPVGLPRGTRRPQQREFEDTMGFLGQLGESLIHQRKHICQKESQVEVGF